MIPLHVLRTGQPQEPTPLELTNPLTQGLVSLPLFSCDGYDAARDFVPTVDDGVTRTASEYGRALRGTTGAEGFNLTAGAGLSSILPVASGYTIMVLMQVVTLGSRRFFLADFGSALTLESIGMEQTATNTWRLYHVDTGVRASTGGAVSLGWHWVELTWDKTTVRGYVDGTALPTSGATANKRAGVDLRAMRAGAGTTLGFDGDMAFLGIWDRVLSLDERDRIQSNPWQLYRPLQRRIWVEVAGGGAATLLPGLLTNAQTFYAPTVQRGAVTVSPGLFTSSATLFAPTVAPGVVAVQPGVLNSAASLYAPSISVGAVTIAPGLLTNASTLYAPVVSAGGSAVQPPLLTNTQQFYSPAVSVGGVTVSPGLLTNATDLFTPVVSGGLVLQAPLLENAQSFFAPAVTAGEVELLPPLLANQAIFFGPTVGSGVTVAPPLLQNTATIFAPTVQPGAAIVAPGLLLNQQGFYGPSVIADQFLLAPLLTNAGSLFSPSVIDESIDVEVESRFIAKPAPRIWTAANTPRNWEARS